MKELEIRTMKQSMTRRDFVRVAALSVLGVGAVGVGAANVSGCSAAGAAKPAVATPSASFGKGSEMSRRILVAYATGKGATVGVAEKIGEELASRGFSADVKPMRERPSLVGYDAIIVGSAVNGGKWLPEAVDFLKANRAALAQVPVAVFCVHAMNCGDIEKETAKRHAYLDEVRAVVRPAAEGYFAGVGPTPQDTSWLAMWAFRAFGGHVVEGDGRDWNKIGAWVQGLTV